MSGKISIVSLILVLLMLLSACKEANQNLSHESQPGGQNTETEEKEPDTEALETEPETEMQTIPETESQTETEEESGEPKPFSYSFSVPGGEESSYLLSQGGMTQTNNSWKLPDVTDAPVYLLPISYCGGVTLEMGLGGSFGVAVSEDGKNYTTIAFCGSAEDETIRKKRFDLSRFAGGKNIYLKAFDANPEDSTGAFLGGGYAVSVQGTLEFVPVLERETWPETEPETEPTALTLANMQLAGEIGLGKKMGGTATLVATGLFGPADLSEMTKVELTITLRNDVNLQQVAQNFKHSSQFEFSAGGACDVREINWLEVMRRPEILALKKGESAKVVLDMADCKDTDVSQSGKTREENLKEITYFRLYWVLNQFTGVTPDLAITSIVCLND